MAAGTYPAFPILIVDDEEHILLSFSRALASAGMDNVVTLSDSGALLETLKNGEFEVLVLDLSMPRISGESLLPGIREAYPDLPVIIVTGVDEVAVAVRCMRLGVFDYLVKAIEKSKLIATVKRAAEMSELKRENSALKRHLVERIFENPDAFSKIVTCSSEMRNIFFYLESIARNNRPVLITGETGVGKELAAEAVHTLSGRQGPLVKINIAGLDGNMFSDTLFGHLKGAYTGAETERKGLIEQAAGGTLFLDEIGDLDSQGQVKLLRLLENGTYYPLGSDAAKRSNARVLLASNTDIKEAAAGGSFRKDLYYRLQTHWVHIPPLRERKEDIPLLADTFIRAACAESGRDLLAVPQPLMDSLMKYNYPGNVRELKSLIYDAVSRSGGPELAAAGVARISGGPDFHEPEAREDVLFTAIAQLPTLKSAAKLLVEEALRRTGGNQAKAAALLGISPQALSKRLKSS